MPDLGCDLVILLPFKAEVSKSVRVWLQAFGYGTKYRKS
jgi:hypothetical protein